jgi:hypothetical protein
VDAQPVLAAMFRRRCRFVVVGSVARQLSGEAVRPADLDIVIDTAPAERVKIVAALVDLEARVVVDGRLRPVTASTALPWRWSWTAVTVFGTIDVIGQFVDGTGFAEHRGDASSVPIGSGATVLFHPTRHVA